MDRRPGLGWLQSWPAMALLLMTLLGVYQRTAPLQKRRPAADRDASKSAASGESFAIDLKLWQDPFDSLPLPSTKIADGQSPANRIDQQFKQIADKLRTILTSPDNTTRQAIQTNVADHLLAAHHATSQIFFIPVDDDRTSEVREVRIRRRQAVIAALRASGLVAESGSQINLLPVDPWYHGTNKSDLRDSAPAAQAKYLAYEWFVTDQLLPDTQRPTATRQALIVWIPSRLFEDRILPGLNDFLWHLSCRFHTPPETLQEYLKQNRLRVTLLGPESSSTLDGILRWSFRNYVNPNQKASSNQQADSLLPYMHIVSPASTYDTALTLEELRRDSRNSLTPQSSSDVHHLEQVLKDERSLLREAHVNFQRTIGRDSALAGRLIRELELRGLNLIPKVIEDKKGTRRFDLGEFNSLDDVAIISESNSLYGRSFPVIFAAAMLSHGHVEQDSQIHQQLLRFLKDGVVPKNLRNYSYLRQVDGS
ncbi:MAG: hypothetical protein ACKOU6_15585, partial [Planctomycetota bacterium]